MKPFTPKLQSARPRVSAALTSPDIQQFQNGNPPTLAEIKKKKKQTGKSPVSIALTQEF